MKKRCSASDINYKYLYNKLRYSNDNIRISI